MIDTGCSVSIVSSEVARKLIIQKNDKIKKQTISCCDLLEVKGSVVLADVEIENSSIGAMCAYVLDKLPLDVGLIVGLDVMLFISKGSILLRRVKLNQLSN